MEELTIILFERIGLLLVFAFMLTRIPSFRYLLDRELNAKTILYHSVIFGILGVAGAQAGVIIVNGEIASRFWIFYLDYGETLVGSSLVAVVIAGLLGGPNVGLGAGFFVAAYLYFLGGDAMLANSLVNPISGLLAGFTARFFSEERIIAPAKALFIGMFTPIIHMALLLIFTSRPEETVELVNTIGIPLVITNSVAIAIFTAMIRAALNEKEQEAALETKRALKIAEEALPHLRQGFHSQSAMAMAQLLCKELKIAAVSITNKEQVLAHYGLGADHHRQGHPLQTLLSSMALETGQIQYAHHSEQIQCQQPQCPLQAAIIVPIRQSGEVAGLIKLYFKRSQQIRAVEVALAQGLGKLISIQLDVVAAEKMKALLQEAELRTLQAQINPHFLFNTLSSIATLVRVNPMLARHLIVQLGYFLRSSLKITSTSLIPLEQELKHLQAYLEIVKVRFSDQLSIVCEIAENVGEELIPPFTLQPLVENCIEHGLKDVTSKGEIVIRIHRIGTDTRIEVRDNGTGIPPHILERLGKQHVASNKGNGIGIYNVNQRLTSLMGSQACLTFKNEASGGCSISFLLPHSHKKEAEGA